MSIDIALESIHNAIRVCNRLQGRDPERIRIHDLIPDNYAVVVPLDKGGGLNVDGDCLGDRVEVLINRRTWNHIIGTVTLNFYPPKLWGVVVVE